MAEREWVTCDVCNRVLWKEDGPTCEDCLALKEKKEPAKSAKPAEPTKKEAS
jgi:hypothetical protein